MGKKYQGVLTEKEEFLYPDSVSETLPESIRVVMPKNGKQGIQLLLDTTGDEIQMDFEGDGFYAEWYEMIAVPEMGKIKAERWYLWRSRKKHRLMQQERRRFSSMIA